MFLMNFRSKLLTLAYLLSITIAQAGLFKDKQAKISNVTEKVYSRLLSSTQIGELTFGELTFEEKNLLPSLESTTGQKVIWETFQKNKENIDAVLKTILFGNGTCRLTDFETMDMDDEKLECLNACKQKIDLLILQKKSGTDREKNNTSATPKSSWINSHYLTTGGLICLILGGTFILVKKFRNKNRSNALKVGKNGALPAKKFQNETQKPEISQFF